MTEANKERLRQLGWSKVAPSPYAARPTANAGLRKAHGVLTAELQKIGGCLDPDCLVLTPLRGRRLPGGCACVGNPEKMRRVVGAYRAWRSTSVQLIGTKVRP
jgi:hypothetical protein